MSNNAVREKHLKALAEVTKNYTDEELANVSGGSAANIQVFTGATNLIGGASGLVPAPLAGDQDKFLSAGGSWVTIANEEYTLPTASNTVKGGVKVGSGLQMDGDTLNVTLTAGSDYTLPTASTTTKGGVKIGNGVSLNGDSLNVKLATASGLTISSGSVSLKTASTTQKGGIKVGTGLAMNGDTLNCTITGGSTGSSSAIVLSNSSSTVNGAVWIDTDIASLDGSSAIVLPTLPPSPLVNGSMWLVITDD